MPYRSRSNISSCTLTSSLRLTTKWLCLSRHASWFGRPKGWDVRWRCGGLSSGRLSSGSGGFLEVQCRSKQRCEQHVRSIQNTRLYKPDRSRSSTHHCGLSRRLFARRARTWSRFICPVRRGLVTTSVWSWIVCRGVSCQSINFTD